MSARAAFGGWAATPAAERAQYLEAIRGLIAARAGALAELITADLGAPLAFARDEHVGTPVAVLASYVELLGSYNFGGDRVGNSLVVCEAAGVAGAITPWSWCCR